MCGRECPSAQFAAASVGARARTLLLATMTPPSVLLLELAPLAVVASFR